MIVRSLIKLNYLILYLILFVLSCGCTTKDVTICHAPSDRCLRIEDKITTRTIYFDSQANSDYVKLDISKINKVTDGVFICFENQRIEVINPKSMLIESHFNEEKYSFSSEMELNNEGMPNILKFHNKGCLEFNMNEKEIFPKDGIIYMK